MASPSAISSVINWTTNAGFQAVVSEVVTALFTTLGLTQTADTGQINPATVTAPTVANTSQGYVIGRFNDTLQSTSPIFFKLEFGSDAAAARPQIWLTVGQGSNGSGTLTGTLTTRRACLWGGVQISTTSPYTSRYCYIPAQGYLGINFKLGGVTAAAVDTFMGSLYIIRSTDATGAPTSNAVQVVTSGNSAVGPGNVATNGYSEFYSYSAAALFPAAPTSNVAAMGAGSILPLGLTATLNGSTAYLIPTYTMDPAIRFSACLAIALTSEMPLATQQSLTLVGSAAMNFISAGRPFGCTAGIFGSGFTQSLVEPWQ